MFIHNSNSNGHGAEDSKFGRGSTTGAGGKENYDTWSNASGESDLIDSQMDLVYKYSSEDDSDEENHNPLSRRGRGSFNRSNSGSSGTYIQKRGSGKGNSYRGSTPLRNSSVTPPPCVLRKFRREQNGTASNGLKSKNAKEIDRSSSPSPILLPLDGDMKPQRTSSGSSLSTLTADTYVSNNVKLMGHYGKQDLYSSLQRCKTGNNNGNRVVSSSANASPLLGKSSCLQNGPCHRSNPGGGSNPGSISPYGANSPNGTFDRSAANGSAAKAFHLERSMHNVSKELEAVSQDAKQLESDVNGMKQDIGNVQDNLATVRTYVDSTKDKVVKLQSQVGSIEKQVASIVKEAQSMREQAKKLLEIAENSKLTHENLMEEAEHLVNFLRQSTSCMSVPYHHQHAHTRAQFPPSCCSTGNSTSGSQYYGTTNGIGPPPQPIYSGPITSLRRKKGKSPERADSDPEMELLDETQTQMENIIAKHRKSKLLLSGSSSSGSAGSNNQNHGMSSNRNSIIEMGENNGIGRSLNNNNRSPKVDGRS